MNFALFWGSHSAHWGAYVVHTPQKINHLLYYSNLCIKHAKYMWAINGQQFDLTKVRTLAALGAEKIDYEILGIFEQILLYECTKVMKFRNILLVLMDGFPNFSPLSHHVPTPIYL